MTSIQDDEKIEKTESEAWYDSEIAPALAELAQRCNARGMSFISQVEYEPGERGATYFLTSDAGLSMKMARLCFMSGNNVDGYIMKLQRLCQEEGIDTAASFVMTRCFKPAPPG